MITKEEMHEVAQQAADAALQKLFLSLDLDVNDTKEVRRFREDLNFLKNQRDGSEKMKAGLKKSSIYIGTTVIAGMFYFGWDIIKSGFRDVLLAFLGRGGL